MLIPLPATCLPELVERFLEHLGRSNERVRLRRLDRLLLLLGRKVA
jgi:hypothetical protein